MGRPDNSRDSRDGRDGRDGGNGRHACDDRVGDGDRDARSHDRTTTAAAGAVQPTLPFDDPVPYRLTTVGRRLVAPHDEPTLSVVPGRHDAAAGTAVVLESLDAADRARARAMRRGGMHTLDIAERLDVDPLHVGQWVADLPVPLSPRRRRLAALPAVADGEGAGAATTAARDAVVAAWRAARDDGRADAEHRLAKDPGLRAGLGLVAGCFEPDHHALLLVGDDVDLLAAAWRWLSTTLDADEGPARVLVRHDPADAGDHIARSVATTLGLPVSALTVTRDVARTGRGPAVRVRVADPGLAGRVAGWRRALLVAVAHPGSATGAEVGA